MTSFVEWAMVFGSPPAEEGKRAHMSGKSPRGNDSKKQPQLSLKEKRAQKREKSEDGLIKTRKR